MHQHKMPKGPRERVVLEIPPNSQPIRLVLVKTSYRQPGDTDEQYAEHQRFFYEEHTCPTNWTDEIVQIQVGDDHDPHGFARFVESTSMRSVVGPFWCCYECESPTGRDVKGRAPVKPDRCDLCGQVTEDLHVPPDMEIVERYTSELEAATEALISAAEDDQRVGADVLERARKALAAVRS